MRQLIDTSQDGPQRVLPAGRSTLLLLIRRNQFNSDLNLNEQFPFDIHEPDFLEAIAARRLRIRDDITNLANQQANLIRQAANDPEVNMPAEIYDLAAPIAEFAVNYPAENLGALMFPELTADQRQQAVTEFLSGNQN